MTIELGLGRIGRLLEHTKLPWKAIHVAGTNGKGSICAYTSAMLCAADVRCGRFTSPHLIDRWDCIAIDQKVVRKTLFQEVEGRVKQHDAKNGIGASEFEILTAIAFEIFNQENVDVGVVEVGLGGRLDATNVLQNTAVTVIAKIGYDHQFLLGNSLEEIAYQKAGIMRRGVPCVVDNTNEPGVLDVLDRYAKEIGTGSSVKVPWYGNHNGELRDFLEKNSLEPHQRVNLHCAFEAVKETLKQMRPQRNPLDLLQAAVEAPWPGRLQKQSIECLTGRKEDILVDGAHNGQSAAMLGSYVNEKLRHGTQCVTWVLAASRGKDLQELLRPLVRTGDNVVAVEFGPVDGMPWVQPAPSGEILDMLRRGQELGEHLDAGGDLLGALRWGSKTAHGRPLVVAGSLYLVSDILRVLRDAGDGA